MPKCAELQNKEQKVAAISYFL